MYSWIASMRKKPIEERRRFAASVTIAIMAGVTVIWFILFFTTVPERLKKADETKPEAATASVIEGVKKPVTPFSGN
jgi:cytoskeletal protein RodZ